jgi:fatty acid desaturase
MEIGHNVMHGQWNWMNDPEIHSTNWEWDMNAVSKHWVSAHNVTHHKYTNILDMDDDVGYFILRVPVTSLGSPTTSAIYFSILSSRWGSSGESACRPSIWKRS